MSPEEAARRAQWRNRLAFQTAQEAALRGSDAVAAEVVADWEPIDQFLTDGPDIGERGVPEDELDSERRWKERAKTWL